MISENLMSFAGKEVKDWSEENEVVEPARFHYRLRLGWEEADDKEWTDLFAAFLDSVDTEQVTGLVIGDWGHSGEGNDSQPVVETLVAARERLPNLTALFLGDMTSEESEISWIIQSDVSPLFTAYPDLEYFGVRGGQSLSFGGLRHEKLKSLVVETGGLSATTLHEVTSAQLPALEHLELWLGDEDYGWDGTLEDVLPLLNGSLFSNLRYLGLRNSQIVDEIAAALATAPIMERIRVLDLSGGTLSDEGAEILLTSPALTKLEKLDLHFHYLSDEMMEKFEALPIPVDLNYQQAEDEYGRYVSVGE